MGWTSGTSSVMLPLCEAALSRGCDAVEGNCMPLELIDVVSGGVVVGASLGIPVVLSSFVIDRFGARAHLIFDSSAERGEPLKVQTISPHGFDPSINIFGVLIFAGFFVIS